MLVEVFGLLEAITHLKQRQIHGNQDHPDNQTQENDNKRFHHAA